MEARASEAPTDVGDVGKRVEIAEYAVAIQDYHIGAPAYAITPVRKNVKLVLRDNG